MAEALVSTILGQLASLAAEEMKLLACADKAVGKLTSNFQAIQAVLEDAESRQIKEKSVGDWFEKLKDVSYDIEDALDEWITVSKKSQMKEAENASKLWKKVCSCISSDCFCCKKVFLRHEIATKIKDLNERLDVIAMERIAFNFSLSRGTGQPVHEITTSLINLPEIYGRDHDRDRLKDYLLAESSQESTVSTISIVGMGGIGKTTLAQLVFNNDEVNTHFHKKIWVCVSDPFDEIRIAKAILESLLGEKKDKDELENVLQDLRQSIKDKKILLVLDDVWIDNSTKWEKVKNALHFASQGSRILVTTRKESTAIIMGSTKTIQIGRLGDDESWSLFSQVAFFGKTKKEVENLKEIGGKIVEKCDGLPLAIKTLGSLLRLKTQAKQWQSVIDSDLWKLEEIEKELFPPILLSYYDLSSKLRKCFTYCAVFPKDYVIGKDILIRLWMAQGFLNVEGNKEMELVGEEYFENLVMRSLFQDFERSEYDGSIVRCKMHDIVHDFVQFVSKNECFAREVESDAIPQLKISSESVRHLYIRSSDSLRVPASILKLKKLRSFVVENVGPKEEGISGHFEQFTCLRTLNLSHYDYKIPKGIKYLEHLRYLKLNWNDDIETLPEVLCDLYNLQTLDVTNCKKIRKLPQGIGKLVNLRHLLIGGTGRLRYIPKGVERLSCLKTLNKFVINGDYDYGNKACNSLDSLKNLRLGPSLELELVNVRDSNALKLADFQSTKNLLHLTLSFYVQCDERSRNKKNVMIIEALQPPPNLEKLRIKYFGGKSMSFDWMISLIKLKELELFYCFNCEHLPLLGKLPSLESLKIELMRSIKRVGNEFLGIENDATSSIVAFPKLKFLLVRDLSFWEEWNDDKYITIMPCLHSLSIKRCPKLKALPDQILQTPTLQQLEIVYCSFLEERYKETGHDRSKISHIPKVSISHW
ncbi:putative disease resistance protein RGA3 [Pistacia vera]|uniref:putative disease resistance protein RGA3 n=1 Tax=Pistacia vera TaxID=55513 RepID=UPI001263C573|nr:putative disease resistance protein RGA3 [Pistacia vera]